MRAGHRLGAYELVEELGAGGMGIVWRAHDRRLGRDVALKFLPPHLADHPDSLGRFEREARGLAAISHPNIVSIFDLGSEEGHRYLVTELLHGETLRERIRRGRIPWREATDIAATIADGLAAAHSRGIVHRDLKPENIFITSDGRAKILDFGLAKDVSLGRHDATTQAHHTEPGMVVGTLGYMSPEQLRGEEIGPPTDIFSLGCVLYEMLAGRPAFLRGNAAETIASIMSAQVPSLPSAETPPDLKRMLQRCLEKDPRARFQSSKDLAFALRDLSMTRPTVFRDERLPGRWQTGGMVALLVMTIAVGWWVSRGEKTPTRSVIPAKPFSLTIVPFEATSEDAFVGEGLADSVFRRLAVQQPLHVLWRRAAPSRPEALLPTGATHLLRGSLEKKDANRIVNAEIIELENGRTVWKQRYHATAVDLLGLERQVGEDVEAFFRQRVVAAEGARDKFTSTVNQEAYTEYLKGRHQWNKFNLASFRKSIDHFQRAIDVDPTYALAHAGLADAYSILSFHGGGDPDEMMPKAKAAARRAIELDPNLSEPYVSLGYVLVLHEWNWREGEVALKRALELNPRHAFAHHAYAVFLGYMGRYDEALREINIASELDPLSIVIYLDQAWTHYLRGERDAALESARRAIRHDPNNPLAHSEYSWYLDQVGRYEEALDEYETFLRLGNEDAAAVKLLRDVFRSEGARGYLRKRLELAVAAGEPHTSRAGLLIRLGEIEKALDEIELAYEQKERGVLYFKSPIYDPVRTHPRFERVLAGLDFPR